VTSTGQPSRLPRITVITPSFNQAAYLEQTIRSVLDQDYPNLEYIVVDGGSADGSVDIIRRFEHRLAWWVSEPDSGQAHAINKGLARATGDILAYLNSDDLYQPGALLRVAECFRRHPDADLLHGWCRMIDADGRTADRRAGSISRYDEILDLWGVWWKQRNFVQPEVFWTKRIAKRVGPFREDLHWVMDYEYWLRILRAGGKVERIDAELAAFRIHPEQKSSLGERAAAELLQVVRPFIWESSPDVGAVRRLSLKGQWAYDALFRSAAQASRLRGESRWRRWALLAGLWARHPQMVLSEGFADRLSNVFRHGSSVDALSARRANE
jgi:glycosyltransferase involved in cell wall biosynthesis